jgi:quercetin dioxygenase-like cupin family protein
MAVIVLKPGERFSHSHDVISTTRLLTGNIELTFGGTTTTLTAVPVVIPADTLHTVHNVGVKIAKAECDYGVGGEDG